MGEVRAARVGDFPRLQEIEVQAGSLFREVGLGFIADMPPPPEDYLRAFTDAGSCWVAETDVVAGYLLVEEIGGCGHIAQVSVDPRFRGQRLGSRLIDQAGAWAKENRLHALTLTTYRDLPWNAPYYERIGFRIIEPTPALSVLVKYETKIGLDPAARVCMRREL
ncbi:GNAT family N-acetyltransferase [Actinokineospora sp. HUAS TT18]|uniref:GNAT family N-acetyltransferase n=1 Tax=Actinokineospora sp. HUAS TT18 TaxID=3447451 RepID=UPI003F5259EF